MSFYSIGHSNASFETFLALLQHHRIHVLVDVRSQPYSRYNPHFGRERLKRALEENAVKYHFLGDRIGGRPADDNYRLEDGRTDYEKLASSAFFLEGIERLISMAEPHNLCFMCAEADFKKCHRYWLITRTLVDRGIVVNHILHSGEILISDRSDFEGEQLGLFK
jgi:uncharacterized protein (DUF488 family)